MTLINEKISSELELEILKDETRQEFLKIIGRMKQEDGIQAVILGCMELPLILNDDVPCPLPGHDGNSCAGKGGCHYR